MAEKRSNHEEPPQSLSILILTNTRNSRDLSFLNQNLRAVSRTGVPLSFCFQRPRSQPLPENLTSHHVFVCDRDGLEVIYEQVSTIDHPAIIVLLTTNPSQIPALDLPEHIIFEAFNPMLPATPLETVRLPLSAKICDHFGLPRFPPKPVE